MLIRCKLGLVYRIYSVATQNLSLLEPNVVRVRRAVALPLRQDACLMKMDDFVKSIS